MVFMWQTGGIHKMAVGHTQLFGVMVHQVGKGLLGACQVFSQRNTGVIA